MDDKLLVKKLQDDLVTAQNEAKLAAEIGQQLVSTNSEISSQLEKANAMIAKLKESESEKEKTIQLLQAEKKSADDRLEENHIESKSLSKRNETTSKKVQSLTRDNLALSQKVLDLEAQNDELTRLMQVEKSKSSEALSEVNRLRDLLNRPPGTPIKRNLPPRVPVTTPEAPKQQAAAPSSPGAPPSIKTSGAEEFLYNTPVKPNSQRLHDELEVARTESAESKRHIKDLEEKLDKKSMENQLSCRKVNQLERTVEEYVELLKQQEEKLRNFADGSEEQDTEESIPLTIQLLHQRLAQLESENRESELKIAKQNTELTKLRKARRGRGDSGRSKVSEEDDDEYSDDDEEEEEEEDAGPPPEVRLRRRLDSKTPRGMTGFLNVKPRDDNMMAKFQRAKKMWKTRCVELIGEGMFIYKNVWDVSPLIKFPLDGSEVRLLRIPHQDATIAAGSASRGLHVESLKFVESSFTRYGNVFHEFHVWHTSGRLVRLSVATEEDMMEWANCIQTFNPGFSIMPKICFAGYAHVATETQTGIMSKFQPHFMVLRSDGMYLYRHPASFVVQKIINIDHHAQAWTPSHSEDQPLPRLDGKPHFLCLKTQSKNVLYIATATEADKEWWVRRIQDYRDGKFK